MAKVFNQHGYKHGLFTGYTEYRYGRDKPIPLAKVSIQNAQPKPLPRGEKKKHLVNQVVDVMRDWRKTPFENEGAVRAGLRSAFCDSGHGWAISDHQAAEIISAAFANMGAKRPSWEEGQPGYTNGSEYCHWCFCAIPEEDQTPGRRFCSVECARVGLQHMTRLTNHHYGAVLRSAIRLIDREKVPARDCRYCGTSFKSDAKNQRFCSSRCAGLFNAGDRVLNERECTFCHATYKPITQDQQFCSKVCSKRHRDRRIAEAMAGIIRICGCCGASFQPKTPKAKYCTPKCQSDMGKRTYAKKKQEANRPKPRMCDCCGYTFRPSINGSRFCCKKCASEASRFGKGVKPRKLTPLVFDHFVAKPMNVRWNGYLTPQRFDWIVINQGLKVTTEVAI